MSETIIYFTRMNTNDSLNIPKPIRERFGLKHHDMFRVTLEKIEKNTEEVVKE